MQRYNLLGKLEKLRVVQAVRNGLIMTIPILMTGAFALIFKTLPIPAYQRFISSFLDGSLLLLFSMVHTASFGMVSLYVTAAVSYSYMREKSSSNLNAYAAQISAILVFSIFSGVFAATSSAEALSYLGVNGMFSALVSAIFAASLYQYFTFLFPIHTKFHSDGADYLFNNSVQSLIPVFMVTLSAAAINVLIFYIFHDTGIQELFIAGTHSIFDNIKHSFLSGLLFVFSSSMMWFFGIHGGNVLNNVSTSVFGPAMELNIAAAASGAVPTHILTKTFLDEFVLLGGCGTGLSLVLAIFLFSKRGSTRNLAKLSIIPMIFNINEILIFGFPVILNPVLFIPFICTPLVSYIIAYAALYFHIVPIPHVYVDWTTPSLLGGYIATGSANAAILQIFIIAVGILIYRPFVIWYDNSRQRAVYSNFNSLVDTLKEFEANFDPVTLTELPGARGAVAREISEELESSIGSAELTMYYQPQFDKDMNAVGAEALLRWKHPIYAAIYPPLVIKLAYEKGMLLKLEVEIFRRVIADIPQLMTIGDIKYVSINVSGNTIVKQEFFNFLKKCRDTEPSLPERIHLEITEQMVFSTDFETEKRLNEIKALGYSLEIDDFSMGSTSIKYLQDNLFNTVKLDGTLVTDMRKNDRSREIIASIIHLSNTLGIGVIAEYVEDEEMLDMLSKMGCSVYQGYLFSPAVTLDDLKKLPRRNKNES